MDKVSILNIKRENLTPGMKQYRDAKEAHPDCIILLRMGDFYELFYEDAITASKVLEITLTSRGKGDKQAPLAGVPYHSLEPYLAKLVKQGFKVAIVEQLEDPKEAKGLVKRGVVRIVSPGTVIEDSMLSSKENNYVMTISCSKAFAIAVADLSTGEFFTRTLDDQASLLNEVSRVNPSEVLMPFSLQVNGELVNLIQKDRFVDFIDDKYFKIAEAEEILKMHFKVPTLDSLGLTNNLSMAVTGALLHHLKATQKTSLDHLQNLTVLGSTNRMLLDRSTISNLELLRNIRDGSTRGTLISVLDQTLTPMGGRLLKRWIKEPLLHKHEILARQNAVGDLAGQVILREELSKILQGIYDIERLISRANYGNANPRDLIALKHSLITIPEIQKILANQPGLLSGICQMQSFSDLVHTLESIKDEPPLTLREGGMIKEGFSPELDDLQKIKKGSRKFLQELESREKKSTGIPTLRLGFNRVFGYFFEITKKNLDLVPKHYIRKQTTANSERYITEELKIEEEKILGAEEKINHLEFSLFHGIIKEVIKDTRQLQKLAAQLAIVDCLGSLAKVSTENNYSRPEIVEDEIIQIRKGRHPVVEKLSQRYISNDVTLTTGGMMIITGSNMSGKSTVMRQVALTVLMAQMGSFVPAELTCIGITDRIFTRVGASDDLSSGQSTFMMEMQETSAILHNATNRSLIILDEIGRGTSTFDGVSIAWSVAEHINNEIKARTLFATHYHVMNKLADKFTRIRNFNMAVQEFKGEIVMLHKLIEGATDQSHGIHVARLAGMPAAVISRAGEIQEILQRDDEMVRKIKAKKLEEQKGLGEY